MVSSSSSSGYPMNPINMEDLNTPLTSDHRITVSRSEASTMRMSPLIVHSSGGRPTGTPTTGLPPPPGGPPPVASNGSRTVTAQEFNRVESQLLALQRKVNIAVNVGVVVFCVALGWFVRSSAFK
ncbi:hypothetical protein L1887_28285 [Cichorium endivia]|nr:hypothetical protein L1887_28285 [Cichorium endivia]